VIQSRRYSDHLIYFKRPPDHVIYERLRDTIGTAFTYDAVGGTEGEVPPGYFKTSCQGEVGRGQDAFDRARAALRALKPFRLKWVEFIPERGLRVGARICVVSNQLGFWALNLSRIVYLIDEPNRFGFAVGTLTRHLARGEERFMVQREEDDVVNFQVFSFSRPAHWLFWLGFPVARFFQKLFVRACVRAMQDAVLTPPRSRPSGSRSPSERA